MIKNAVAAHVDPALQPNRLNVNVEGIKVEDILFQVNIDEVIRYYGITELLDTIGAEEVQLHLDTGLEGKSETELKDQNKYPGQPV